MSQTRLLTCCLEEIKPYFAIYLGPQLHSQDAPLSLVLHRSQWPKPLSSPWHKPPETTSCVTATPVVDLRSSPPMCLCSRLPNKMEQTFKNTLIVIIVQYISHLSALIAPGVETLSPEFIPH